MSESKPKRWLRDIEDESERMEAAAQRAVRDRMRVHKALGHSIVVWRDGKIVEIAAKDIDVVPIEDDPFADPARLPW